MVIAASDVGARYVFSNCCRLCGNRYDLIVLIGVTVLLLVILFSASLQVLLLDLVLLPVLVVAIMSIVLFLTRLLVLDRPRAPVRCSWGQLFSLLQPKRWEINKFETRSINLTILVGG